VALVLVALAVVSAAGVWFLAAGPIGHWRGHRGTQRHRQWGDFCCRSRWSSAGVVLMRSEPKPEARPRLVIGALLFSLALLGILHLAGHLPITNGDRMRAGARSAISPAASWPRG